MPTYPREGADTLISEYRIPVNALYITLISPPPRPPSTTWNHHYVWLVQGENSNLVRTFVHEVGARGLEQQLRGAQEEVRQVQQTDSGAAFWPAFVFATYRKDEAQSWHIEG